jgi:PD-(D/E)XK nuclease superfamily protein
MRIISRSGHQTFRQCPRKYYYGYLKDGTGYAGKGVSLDLILGLAVHQGLESLLKTGDIEGAVRDALSRYDEESKASWPAEGMEEQKAAAHAFNVMEWHHLTEALVRGWYRVRYPIFSEKYEIVDIEQERRTPLAPNVVLASRGDILVRDKLSGELILFNWKTTSSTKDWDVKWHWDVQAWTETLAEEHAKGERVAGCLFEGLYKSVRKDNRQCTTLLYGYKLEGDSPTQYKTEYVKPSKAAPWTRFRAWEEKAFGPEPIKYWINWLPWNEVAQYFITSNPVMKNDLVMEKWITQVVRLETEIEHMLRDEVTEEERLTYFIQNFSHFNCGKCQFRFICKGETSIEEAIKAGRFMPRVDHHGGEEVEGAA